MNLTLLRLLFIKPNDCLMSIITPNIEQLANACNNLVCWFFVYKNISSFASLYKPLGQAVCFELILLADLNFKICKIFSLQNFCVNSLLWFSITKNSSLSSGLYFAQLTLKTSKISLNSPQTNPHNLNLCCPPTTTLV